MSETRTPNAAFFSSAVKSQSALWVDPILPKRRAEPCRNSPQLQTEIQAEQRSQYLRDLDQVADDEACFFCAMGELIAARMEGNQ